MKRAVASATVSATSLDLMTFTHPPKVRYVHVLEHFTSTMSCPSRSRPKPGNTCKRDHASRLRLKRTKPEKVTVGLKLSRRGCLSQECLLTIDGPGAG